MKVQKTIPISRMLGEARLPAESECIGIIFAFSWKDEHEVLHRVVGKIDGLDYSGNCNGIRIISNSLLSRKRGAEAPVIVFDAEFISFTKQIFPAKWSICFNDLDLAEQNSSRKQTYAGEFKIL